MIYLNRKEYHKMYMRKRREILIDNNICPVCGTRKRMENYSICTKCREYQLNYRAKIRGILNNARR